ncbi:MAG: M15 family metallopeptidase [Myxococcaceae bacterium]|nr:M15 family metallopeptidase [Myxococcaceae bacterium]MCI0670509.1 M15 family metallopeptidase [Myxococcaceae bacterium]
MLGCLPVLMLLAAPPGPGAPTVELWLGGDVHLGPGGKQVLAPLAPALQGALAGSLPARATEPTPPAPLACLARYYAARPELRDGKWFAVLPDGTAIPYDDGRAKSFEQKLESPDVEDTFSIPYQAGPIRPVRTPDEDPGRIRLDAVFKATYGASADKVDVVPIRFLGSPLEVHRKAVSAFTAVEKRLKEALAKDPSLEPYLMGVGGTFNWRNIAGTDRPSSHSYGVSMDINTRRSHYWRWAKGPITWKNAIPQAIVDAFEAEGFIWGGRWYHYDTMHFEYRPELLDPACFGQ